MPTFGEQRLHELTRRLLHVMDSGSENANVKLDWQESDRANAYHCSIGDATIVIASVDKDGRAPYALEVLDEDGAVIDSLETTVWVDDSGLQHWADWNHDLETLYDRAHRSVKNVDVILDRIMNLLPPEPKGFSDDPPF